MPNRDWLRKPAVGFGLGAIAVALLVWFVWALLAPVPSRIAPPQYGEELYTGYQSNKGSCDPKRLQAISDPVLRAEKIEACEKEAESYRISKEGLAQAARVTDATEESLRVADSQNRIAFIQAILTTLALAFTAWAAWAAAAAANAARAAVEVIPIIEKAYPFIVIEDESMAQGLSAAAQSSREMAHPQNFVRLSFRVKNYGNTPATIKDIVAKISIVRATGSAVSSKECVPYQSVLATGDQTEEFSAESKSMYADDFFGIQNGTVRVDFLGKIVYQDVWRKRHTERFWWFYNPLLRKFVPGPREKPEDEDIPQSDHPTPPIPR